MLDAADSTILGYYYEEIVMSVEEKRKLRDKLVHFEAAAHSQLDVLEAVAQGEGQFLDGGRAGFADVIAADGNGVELGRVLYAELEGVNYQAHRGFRRVDVFLLRNVFLEDVVLERAGNRFPVSALLFGDGQVHRPNHRGGRIDGHRSSDIGEGNFVEEHFHVGERTDGHAALADFSFGECVIGVVAHQRGQVESRGEAGLALREEITEALVGVLGGPEACELPHGPEAASGPFGK